MMRITLLLFLCLSHMLSAQTVIWDGGANTSNWTDAANWDTDILPRVGDSVIIAMDSVSLMGIDPAIKNLLLLNGTKLRIFTSLTFTGSLSYAIRLDNSSLKNNGDIIILDVGDNEFKHRAVELINGSHFHNWLIKNLEQFKSIYLPLMAFGEKEEN